MVIPRVKLNGISLANIQGNIERNLLRETLGDLPLNPILISFVISSVCIAALSRFLLDQEILSSRKKVKPCVNSISSGQKLYQELLGINSYTLGRGKFIEPTRYKFFSELLEELLIFYRNSGANIFEHLQELRKALLKDLKNEKQIVSMSRGSYGEMLIVALLGVCFSLFASLFAGVKIPAGACVIAFSWQLLGGLVFLALERQLRKRIFSSFGTYIGAACKLEIFLKLNRPVNSVARQIALESLPADKSLEHIKRRMEDIIRVVKENGGCDNQQLKEVALECWFSLEHKLEEFNRSTKGLKLFILTAFFLSGYLYLFYSMLGGLYAGH